MVESRAESAKVWPAGQIWLLPVFVNRVLLEHNIAHLFTYCGGCSRVPKAWKQRLMMGPSPKTFVDS